MFSASLDLDSFQLQFARATRAAINSTAREALLLEGARLRGEAREQFLTEGRHGGTPGPPRRLESRISNLKSRPLMIKSGLLLSSLTEEHHPAHVERLDVDDQGIPQLVFGTTVSYARFHQEGTRFMPARSLLTPSMLGGSRVRTEFSL